MERKREERVRKEREDVMKRGKEKKQEKGNSERWKWRNQGGSWSEKGEFR